MNTSTSCRNQAYLTLSPAVNKSFNRVSRRNIVFKVPRKPKVVVLGSGWAAYRFIHEIDKESYHVTVVSPRNHFLFTPLLASTTTGTLEFRAIIEPIRSARRELQYYQAKCIGIDAEKKTITCEEVHAPNVKFSLDFDELVVAVGADNNTFNIPGVKEHAVFLKELQHARVIRSKIIENFEAASIPGVTPEERRRLLHFVVVGGGPTGVEFAAELADFFWQDLSDYFPEVPINDVRITLLEAGPTILSSFNQSLVEHAIKAIKKQGVDLRTANRVKEVREGAVVLQDGTVIPCGLVVWSTGVGPRKLTQSLNWPKRGDRILVDNHLKVKGFEHIYAMGDCAEIEDDPLPATAQVASQQGAYLAKRLNALAKGKQSVADKPFHFKFLGLMTYIGSYKSIMDTPSFKGSGFIEWVIWRSVYLTRLGSFKAKLQVPFNWFKTIVWGRDVTNF